MPSKKFTTLRAYKIAKGLADNKLKKYKVDEFGNIVCNSCKGKGTYMHKGPVCTVYGQVYSEEELNKETEESCFSCFGKGELSKERMLNKLIYKNCWCKCGDDDDNDTGTKCYEYDKVFGNTTYLCCECGMVKQFG